MIVGNRISVVLLLATPKTCLSGFVDPSLASPQYHRK